MYVSVIREGHVPLFVFGYWLCSSWIRTKTVRRQNDSAVSLSVPSLKLNPGSHTHTHTHTHTHSLFKAPSSLLLWWKNTVWCLFFFLLHSNCVTPSMGEVRVQAQRCRSTTRRMVGTHRPANLCLFSSWATVSHWQGHSLLHIFISKLFLVSFPFITVCPGLRHLQHYPAEMSSYRGLQHRWCVKWAVTPQRGCLLHKRPV